MTILNTVGASIPAKLVEGLLKEKGVTKDSWAGGGQDYLTNLAKTESTGAASLNEIADLYRQGFGREPDREGLMYWGSSGQNLQDIAKAFEASEEAKIRTSYSDHYGRDIDDEGLNYWMEHTGEDTYTADEDKRIETLSQPEGSAAHQFDASDLVERTLKSESQFVGPVKTTFENKPTITSAGVRPNTTDTPLKTGETPTEFNPEQASSQFQDFELEVPTKPDISDTISKDVKEIDYMPDLQADPLEETPYGDAKEEFDAEAGVLGEVETPEIKAQDVLQRFTDTSAKGVRMKRSKQSKMGTIKGTKQLGREQQTIKSLNI